jgi:hypothetical protein
MVSSINSVRVWTQQVALKAFNEAANERSGGSSGSGGSLVDQLYAGISDDGDDDTALSSLLSTLRQQAMTGGSAETEPDDGSVDDMSSDAFMKVLQQKIDALAANPDTKAMAETMQAALEAGTLTVTDAVEGSRIVGRALPEKGDASAEKASTPVTPLATDIETVEKSDWSSFLKDHLQRDAYGKYVRNDDTSHKDKVTGASSYFGMIDDTYYYLSWTAPKNGAEVEIQI